MRFVFENFDQNYLDLLKKIMVVHVLGLYSELTEWHVHVLSILNMYVLLTNSPYTWNSQVNSPFFEFGDQQSTDADNITVKVSCPLKEVEGTTLLSN